VAEKGVREQDYPDAAVVLVTSPSPYGTCADLAEIARVCHAHDKPLVVDEAAHLPFHDELPTWAMDAGADVCVVSVHKTGAGFEQGSIFHLQGKRIDPAHLQQCSDLLATTSPNVLRYAAMDGWRRQMVQHGQRRLADALAWPVAREPLWISCPVSTCSRIDCLAPRPRTT
jgi:arginine decarboxylase